jgi:nucleoside-diphosphate-sugar epimerase
MKIFITGSKGYLGRPLVEKLKQNFDVAGYDIADGNDILDYEQLKAAMNGSDIIIHAAAIPKPDETKTFNDYFTVNCVGTLNVAKACVENKIGKLEYVSSAAYYGARIIYVSSTTYYGAERNIPIKFPLKEDQLTVPMYLKADDIKCKDGDLAYSESKIIAENILAFYGLMEKIQITILRFPRIGDKDGPYGTKVSMANAIQGIEKAIACNKTLWYEAFNIADRLDNVNISKAQKILGYEPK